jgi:type IV secretory pathway TrbF-like protein
VIDNPMLAGKLYREDELGEAAVQRANWRYAAFASFGLSGMLILLLAYTILLLRQVPVRVIEVTPESGLVRVTQEAWERYVPPETAYVAQLRDDVTTLRTIILDKEAMKRQHIRSRTRMTAHGKQLYGEYIRSRKPFDQKEPVQVEILSALRDSGLTWDIRWRETTYGDRLLIEYWRGKFTFTKTTPQNDAERYATPLGLFIETWDWGKE